MKSVIVAMEWIPDIEAIKLAEVQVRRGGGG
jgi:hypothetical protein